MSHQCVSAAVHCCARRRSQHLLAGLDHAAVDGPGDDLGDLVGDDGDHHLVEQAHALADPALRDQRPALEVAGERHQIDVGEPIADLGGAGRRSRRRSPSLPSTACWKASGIRR